MPLCSCDNRNLKIKFHFLAKVNTVLMGSSSGSLLTRQRQAVEDVFVELEVCCSQCQQQGPGFLCALAVHLERERERERDWQDAVC